MFSFIALSVRQMLWIYLNNELDDYQFATCFEIVNFKNLLCQPRALRGGVLLRFPSSSQCHSVSVYKLNLSFFWLMFINLRACPFRPYEFIFVYLYIHISAMAERRQWQSAISMPRFGFGHVHDVLVRCDHLSFIFLAHLARSHTAHHSPHQALIYRFCLCPPSGCALFLLWNVLCKQFDHVPSRRLSSPVANVSLPWWLIEFT